MQENKLLIAGNGRAAADALRALGLRGYAVEQVADANLALARLATEGFELALLGEACAPRRLRLCTEIRRRCGDLPILLLGAAPEELEMLNHPHGPDDFVVRELDEVELCARVRSLLDRTVREGAGRPEVPLACGPLSLDPAGRRAGFGGHWVELTATEFQLLRHLVRSTEGAVSRGELLRAVWGYEHDGYSHTLTTHVNRLRSKLEQGLGAPRVIETVRGLGYRIAPAKS